MKNPIRSLGPLLADIRKKKKGGKKKGGREAKQQSEKCNRHFGPFAE